MRLIAIICIFLLSLGAVIAQEPAHEDSPDMGIFAAKAYRPAWAPVPMLQGDASKTVILQKLLASEDSRTRARSAFLLGQIGSPDSVKPLSDLLNDSDRDVRIQAGIALACLGDARGITACATALKESPTWIKLYAVHGLWRTNSPRAMDVLKKSAVTDKGFISRTIKAALKTKYIVPPTAPLPEGDVPPVVASDQLWLETSDLFAEESDWWWHQGNYEQVIRCRETALFLDPTFVENYGLIAWLQWSMGHDAEAIRTLQRGISAVPTDPSVYFELGFHYFNTKRYVQAERYLRKAVDLGGDHLVRRMYAHCLEKLGRLDDALAVWKGLVESRPDDGTAKSNMERVQGLLDDKNR